MRIPKEDEDEKRVLYDPLTGQFVILPQLRGISYSYLGFDPVDKEFKVLFMNTSGFIAYNDTDHHILTLGTGELRWRKIQCPFNHEPFWERICINGVLYYSAQHSDSSGKRSYVIVCFDVRSEKFKFIRAERCHGQLINYKGKLCGIDLDDNDGGFPLKLSMWVLEDVEKPEWSKYVYSLWADIKVARYLSVSGMTATGDIVLSMENTSNPFYVFYFNPRRKTLQYVEIQGFGGYRVCTFVDYVEDLSVNVAMQNKSNPLQQRRNIITEKLKPQQLRHTSRDLCKSAPSVKNQQHNKFPFIACDIFTCEIEMILKTLVEDEELMLLLFSFLEAKETHNSLLAGYFSKVVICLLVRKTIPFMQFIKDHQEILKQLVDLIGITSIMELSKGISLYNCSYASGLIYCSILSKDEDEKRVICNPLTGQYVILPELRVGHSYNYIMFSYLMFDPIDKEFKVLFMNLNRYTAYSYVDHYILTLGSGKLRWRKIQCPFTHELFERRICINGVLYYSAQHSDSDGRRSCVIVCFDVRSEKFKFIGGRCCHYQLINYEGKLCEINVEYAYDGRFPPKLSMWVLEDVEKPEWSKYVYSLDVESKVASYLYVSGMTATGEIVLSEKYTSNPFYVFYFNPERKTLQSVEIQGFGSNRVCAFVDYVEDLSVNVAMQNKSSPLQQGRNIVTEKLKPQQRRHTSSDLCNSSPSVKNKQYNK
ncbi:unnamed protein product, partial [Arabidopsis halleri]